MTSIETAQAVSRLAKQQTPSGAFISLSHWGERVYCDANGFITALVLRETRHWPPSPALTAMRDRALNFLLQCESAEHPGSFGFWPRRAAPEWIRDAPPPDADDTAIYAVELARCGRLDRAALGRIACAVLVPHRLRQVDALAPRWPRQGVFVTWLWPAENKAVEIVDCCVNANVAALLAYAGKQHLPGYREACAMIAAAVEWAGVDLTRARSTTPFYPHPVELGRAVRHAVECGAEELRPCLEQLNRFWPAAEAPPPPDRPVCSSAYGQVVWTAPVLQLARQP
jgi:hypothetical protein